MAAHNCFLKRFFRRLLVPVIFWTAGIVFFSTGGPAAAREKTINYTLTNQGVALYKQKKYSEAIDLLSRQIKITPRDWITLSWRAAAYIDSGQYDKGLKDLDSLLRIEPKSQHSTTYGWYGDIYRKRGDLRKAEQSFKKALRYKDSSFNHTRLAEIYEQQGSLDQAIAEFTAALNDNFFQEMKNLYGINWQAYIFNERGECYLKKNMPDQAYADAQKTVELMPRYKDILKNSGDINLFFDKTRRKKLARSALALAVKENKAGQSDSAFSQLLNAYHWAPLYSGIDRKIIDKMCQLYPQLKENPPLPESARRAFIQAGNLAEKGDYLKALDSYEEVIQICPWYPDSYFNCALLRAETKNYALAVENMKKYLQLVPDASDARTAKDKIYEWESTK